MSLTNVEQDALRFHLGYGNLSVGSEAYARSGFVELFSQVASVYLTVGDETSSTTAVTAGAIAVVMPLAMTGIVASCQLVVDVGDDAEVVMVQAVTPTTFTARFARAHAATGYPIATYRGLARVRWLLWQAEKAHQAMQSQDLVGAAAGVEKADEVTFFQGGWVLKDRLSHYKVIVTMLANVVQIPPAWEARGGGGDTRLEAY